MPKKKPAKEVPPIERPSGNEYYLRIGEAWKAILGLPPDFKFAPLQIMVCMATAEAVMERGSPFVGRPPPTDE